jgi:hypothetical protein
MAVTALYLTRARQLARVSASVASTWISWQGSTAYEVGDKVKSSSTSPWVRVCTTAGTSGGSTPSWTDSEAGTTNDGSVVWTSRAPTSAANAAISIDTIKANITSTATNYVVYVDQSYRPSYYSNATYRTGDTQAGWSQASTYEQHVLFVAVDFGSMRPVPGATTHDYRIATSGVGVVHNANDNTLAPRVFDARKPAFITNWENVGSTSIGGDAYPHSSNTFSPARGARGVTDVDVNLQAGIALLPSARHDRPLAALTLQDASSATSPVYPYPGSAAIGVHHGASSLALSTKLTGTTTTSETFVYAGDLLGGWLHLSDPNESYPFVLPGKHCVCTLDTATYRDSGGTVNGVAASVRVTGVQATCFLGAEWITPYFALYNTLTGARTVTVECFADTAYSPDETMIFMDLWYPGAAGSWLYSNSVGHHTNMGLWGITGSAYTASGSTWTNAAAYPKAFKLARSVTIQKAGPLLVRLTAISRKLVYAGGFNICPQIVVA